MGALDQYTSTVFTTWCYGTAQLKLIQTSQLSQGALAFVYSTKTWYYLDGTSTATADNFSTVQALNGAAGTYVGCWVAVVPNIGGGGGVAINSNVATTNVAAVPAQIVNPLMLVQNTINASGATVYLPNTVGASWFADFSGCTFNSKTITFQCGNNATTAAITSGGASGKAGYWIVITQNNTVVAA
jgi:hypothetical protein